MTKSTGSEKLRRRISSNRGPTGPMRRGKAASPDLDWDDIAFLAEGLAFGPRVLRAATRSVTLRCNLGPRGAWILNVISHGVTYPLELAAVFCVGGSLITSELSRLMEAGLVESCKAKGDRRKSELRLTPLGEEASASIRQDPSAILRRRLAGYEESEVRLAAELLGVLGHEPGES